MKIAAIHYTKLPHECDNIKQNLFDLTEFRMQGALRDLKIFVSTNVTETLNSIADNYDWAVIVATGNYFHGQHLIIETVNHAVAEGSPLICHIMHKGGYFYFHPQWFAIDLKAWSAIGRPSFEEEPRSTFTTTEVERSVENFHDDYTPFWIKPGSTQKTYTTEHGHYGTNVIKGFIEAGYTVINVPNSIRYNKFYSYPDWNYKLIADAINDPNMKLPENSPVRYFHEQIKMLRGNLDTGFYPVNTEKITYGEVPNEPLDCFIGVCGGLKPAWIAGGPTFDENSTVYLVDLSSAALQYQKYLIENWDGELDGFDEIYENFRKLHPDYNPLYFGEIGITKNLDWSLDDQEEYKQEFTRRWKKYRKYKFNFVQINLLEPETASTIKSWVDQLTLGAYIWVSNSFYMDWLTFYMTKAGSENVGKNFIKTITDSNKAKIIYEQCGQITKHQPK